MILFFCFIEKIYKEVTAGITNAMTDSALKKRSNSNQSTRTISSKKPVMQKSMST